MCRNGGVLQENYRLVMLVGVDNANRLVSDNQWFGYAKYEDITYPFILQDGKSLFYGWKEHSVEPTNLADRRIAVGEYFSVYSSPSEAREWESAYLIRSVSVVAESATTSATDA